MQMKWIKVSEFTPPADDVILLIGEKSERMYTYLGKWIPTDEPSAAFHLSNGARIPLAEDFIKWWSSIPPLPAGEPTAEQAEAAASYERVEDETE
jgi:hypothetical protein